MSKTTTSGAPRINRRKAAAIAAAKRRRRRRMAWIMALVIALPLVIGGGLYALTGGNTESAATTTTSSTATTTPPSSAKGKPCVKVANPPKGAPEVPVQVGPPPTKLIVKDLKAGNGAVIKLTDTLTVNYIGVACSTGKVFDSTWPDAKPASFPLAQVIPGWQEGLVGMKVGGSRLLGIPSTLGYGPSGGGPDIAPDEALWFVIDVVTAK